MEQFTTNVKDMPTLSSFLPYIIHAKSTFLVYSSFNVIFYMFFFNDFSILTLSTYCKYYIDYVCASV